MNANFLFQMYALSASAIVAMLGGYTKYDFYWSVFFIGGLITVIGHSIFDQKVKFSAGRLMWTIITSFITCLAIKFLHSEGEISNMTMIISTLISSMIAPAVLASVLKELPAKVSTGILKLPDIFVEALRGKLTSNDKTNENE